MSNRKTRSAWVLAAFAGCMLLVAALYAAIASFALAKASYPQGAPFEGMGDALVAYLRGDVQMLASTFTDQESLHMRDVLSLFRFGRRMAWIFVLSSALMCSGAWLLGGAKNLARGLQIGFATFAVLAVLMGLWALVDFSGWFTAMHEVAFDNDLWLLDPRESMLIQMLPLSFFINAVRTVALRFAAIVALLLGITIAMKRFAAKRA